MTSWIAVGPSPCGRGFIRLSSYWLPATGYWVSSVFLLSTVYCLLSTSSYHIEPRLFARHGVARRAGSDAGEVEGFECRPQWAIHPQWPAQATRIGAAGLGQPALVNLVRPLRIDKDIAV